MHKVNTKVAMRINKNTLSSNTCDWLNELAEEYTVVAFSWTKLAFIMQIMSDNYNPVVFEK